MTFKPSSKQFPSYQEAIAYCKQSGELKYWGRAGVNYEYNVHTLYIGNLVYHVNVYDDGRLEVVHQRYKHKDE